VALQSADAYQLSSGDESLWERGQLSLKGIREAWQLHRDKRTAEYLVKLAQLDPRPEGYAEAMKESPTYDQLLEALRPWRLRREVRALYQAKGGSFTFGEVRRQLLRDSIRELHQAQWDQLDSSAAPLPERLQLHELMMELWEQREPFARETLLEVLRYVPLKWGPWRAVRAIFKASVRERDWEVFGLICARIEVERLTGREGASSPREGFGVSWNHSARDVSARTLSYLQRYGWRVLRSIAQSQAQLYPEVAVQVLKAYPAQLGTYQLNASWIYNHILFHNAPGYAREGRSYSAEVFYHYASDYYSHRAFPELWSERIEPLLALLELGTHEGVTRFCTTSLLNDFRDELKALDASWVSRIASHKRSTLDAFLLTWFQELCPHPQADYEPQGLHKPLLSLLWSAQAQMADYALVYFKAHPSALSSLVSVEQLMGFAQSDRAGLRELAESLLAPSAGRYTLTLAQWTTLLCRARSHSFAAGVIKGLFSSRELSFSWYASCLNAELDEASRFASGLLKDPRYQPQEGSLHAFYWELLSPESWRSKVSALALEGLEAREEGSTERRLLHELSPPQLWALLLHPESSGARALERWCQEGWLSPRLLGVDSLKALLSEERWAEPWWRELLGDEGLSWREGRDYEARFATLAERWLLSGEHFKVEELGARWLLDMAFPEGAWTERRYLDFIERSFEMKHFAALSDQASKRPSAREGAEALIQAFIERGSYDEREALKGLIIARHPASVRAQDPNAKLPSAKRALSDELLSFELFERLCADASEEVRALGLYLARYELRRWTAEAPLSFTRLLPFFMSGAPEVQAALLTAMGTSPRSPAERIDVRLPQFEAQELYAFCFSPRAQVRDLGLSLIAQYPERFMDPGQLALLSESSDRRVCEGVVKALYASLRFKESSCPWRPTAQSVAPRSEVAKRQAELIEEAPPRGRRPSELKGKRYLGLGSSVPSGVDPDSAAWMSDFLRRSVFRLSPGHPYKEDLGRLTPSASAWRNKVNLIKALRDLATQHEPFAALVAPILAELLGSRGRAERDACLVALARIRAAHPGLSV